MTVSVGLLPLTKCAVIFFSVQGLPIPEKTEGPISCGLAQEKYYSHEDGWFNSKDNNFVSEDKRYNAKICRVPENWDSKPFLLGKEVENCKDLLLDR